MQGLQWNLKGLLPSSKIRNVLSDTPSDRLMMSLSMQHSGATTTSNTREKEIITKVIWRHQSSLASSMPECRGWRSLRNLNNTQHYRGRQKSFILPGISSGMSISCEGWGDEAPKLARLQRPYWPGPAPALGTSSEILWNAFWTICAKFFCLKSFNRLFVYICVTKSA